MPKVRFVPLGKDKEVQPGATILSAANQERVPLGQSCNGDGICGWCRVRVLEGRDQLVPPGELERKLFETYAFSREERAACLARVLGDIVITTSYW